MCAVTMHNLSITHSLDAFCPLTHKKKLFIIKYVKHKLKNCIFPFSCLIFVGLSSSMPGQEYMYTANIHTNCRMPDRDSGSVYSCGRNNEEGSQSIVMLPRVSLYSIGHTKNRYWHMIYDICNQHTIQEVKQ